MLMCLKEWNSYCFEISAEQITQITTAVGLKKKKVHIGKDMKC